MHTGYYLFPINLEETIVSHYILREFINVVSDIN